MSGFPTGRAAIRCSCASIAAPTEHASTPVHNLSMVSPKRSVPVVDAWFTSVATPNPEAPTGIRLGRKSAPVTESSRTRGGHTCRVAHSSRNQVGQRV